MLKEHNIPVYDKFEKMLNRNNRAIIVTATGTGKSYLTLEYLERHNKNALVVVYRKSVGREWEKLSKRFQSITYHSFVKTHNFDQWDVIVFDEVHHAGANTWETPITSFIRDTDKPVIGLTADPRRYSDGARDMGEVLFVDSRVDGYSLSEAIRGSILPKLTYVSAFWNVGTFKARYEKRNIPVPLMAKFNYALDKRKPVEDILKERLPESNRKGIIFVETIASARDAEQWFRKILKDTKIWVIHSGQSFKINEKNHDDFKNAKSGFMIAVDMYNEGLHAPGVNTIIMLRRTKSPGIFYQQVGRALHVGEANDPIIFDFVCNSKLVEVNASLRRIKNRISIHKVVREISDQVLLFDYTKDILDVIEEIDNTIDPTWAEEEIGILQKYYVDEGRDIMKRLPDRNWGAIKNKAQRLGLTLRQFYKWTEDEERILRGNLNKNISELKLLLPEKSDVAIKSKAKSFGVKLEYAHHPWTDEENEIIKKNADSMKWVELEKLLPNRNAQSIKAQAHKLGITHTKKWTNDEDEWLKSVYDSMSLDDIAEKLGRDRYAVNVHARKLGLYKGTKRKGGMWNEENVNFLKENYSKMDRNELSKILGIDPKKITAKAHKLGLSKRFE